MILDLVKKEETDIISALEHKCVDSPLYAAFDEDPRVANALDLLEKKDYNLRPGFANLVDQLTFHDDSWLTSYLLIAVGRSNDGDAIRQSVLWDYNPFSVKNPVVNGFAYCEAIENSGSSAELSDVICSMVFYCSRSRQPVMQRMYPYLERIAAKQMRFLEGREKREAYESMVFERVVSLVDEGDTLAKEMNFHEASERYGKAAELAEYQLQDKEMAGQIMSRLGTIGEKALGKRTGLGEDGGVDGDADAGSEKKAVNYR
jgi:hypothetical protein